LKFDLEAVPAQFPTVEVDFEYAEPNNPAYFTPGAHNLPPAA